MRGIDLIRAKIYCLKILYLPYVAQTSDKFQVVVPTTAAGPISMNKILRGSQNFEPVLETERPDFKPVKNSVFVVDKIFAVAFSEFVIQPDFTEFGLAHLELIKKTHSRL
jgi:hypothetical protein